MHDIRAIRDNPDAFDRGLARRGLAPMAADLIRLDAATRDHVQKLQDAPARRNGLSKEIGEAMKVGDKARAEALKADVQGLKDFIGSGEEVERQLNQKLSDALAAIPNLPLDEMPDGTARRSRGSARTRRRPSSRSSGASRSRRGRRSASWETSRGRSRTCPRERAARSSPRRSPS